MENVYIDYEDGKVTLKAEVKEIPVKIAEEIVNVVLEHTRDTCACSLKEEARDLRLSRNVWRTATISCVFAILGMLLRMVI